MFTKPCAQCTILAALFISPHLSSLAQESSDQDPIDAPDIKGQVQHGLNHASGVVVGLGYFYNEHSRFPNDQSESIFLPSYEFQSQFVVSIDIDTKDGIITITFGNDADPEIAGRDLVLSPVMGEAGPIWNCTSKYIDSRYFTQECDPRYSEDGSVVELIEDREVEP